MKREKRLSLAGQQGPAGQGIAILYSFSKYCMLGPVLSALPGYLIDSPQQLSSKVITIYSHFICGKQQLRELIKPTPGYLALELKVRIVPKSS